MAVDSLRKIYEQFLPGEDVTNRLRCIMRELAQGDVSLTRAATVLFDRQKPLGIDMARAEGILDAMWDAGLCFCLGEYHEYAYRITVKGKEAYEHHLL